MKHFAEKFSGALARQAPLKNAGLVVIISKLNWADEPFSFANQLVAVLDELEQLYPPSAGELPHLVVFLKYLLDTEPENYGLHPEDVDLLGKLVEAARQEAKARAGRRQAADEQRQTTLARIKRRRLAGGALTVSRRYQLDQDAVLLDFDLEKQVAQFALTLPASLHGLVNVTVGGPFGLLREYVVERIRQSLDNQGLDVSFDEVLVNPAEVADLWKLVRLGERVSEADVATLLLIFHHDIPPNVMKTSVANLLEEAEKQVVPVLKQKQRLLVLVWAHEGGEALDVPVQLPSLEPYHPNGVVKWLKKQLEDGQVEPLDLKSCLEYLQSKLTASQGHPERTYFTLKEILRTLSRGPQG
jgi:hypothetical protein